MVTNFEQQWRTLVRGERFGLLAGCGQGLLRFMSWPYRFATTVRNKAFDLGLMKSHSVPGALVVSVGNLVVGGTGKTPVILKLCQELSDLPIGVISRGYRSPAERSRYPIVLCQGQGPVHGPDQCGDEPFLIASRYPKTTVVVGRDRYQAAQMAVEANAKLLLLDDGFQHRRLARDVDIIVVDSKDPFGLGFHLPRGFLRESITSLRRADLVIINHVEGAASFAAVKRRINELTDAPVVGMQLQPLGVQTLRGERIASLQNKKVGLFCGIGKPEHFRTSIQKLGAHIVHEHILNDHQAADVDQLAHFSRQCRDHGAELLLCSEKDKVKIDPASRTVIPIAWLGVDLVVRTSHHAWEAFLLSIRKRCGN